MSCYGLMPLMSKYTPVIFIEECCVCRYLMFQNLSPCPAGNPNYERKISRLVQGAAELPNSDCHRDYIYRKKLNIGTCMSEQTV